MDNHTEICGYCVGKPRTLVSSHSGTITLAVSLQEPVVFLAGSQPVAAGSYSEHDNREAATTTINNQPHSEDLDRVASNNNNEDGAANNTTNNNNERHTTPNSTSTNTHQITEQPPAILRGSILLKLTKPTKLKSLSLSFYGKCKTAWNQGPSNPYDDSISAHPLNEIQDEVYINAHNWEFIPQGCCKSTDLNINNCEQSVTSVLTDLYGADAVKLKNEDGVRVANESSKEIMHSPNTTLIANNSAEAGDIPLFGPNPPSSRKKNLFTSGSFHRDSIQFPAGEYVYNFTLAVDSKVPESINAAKGSLKYFLVPKVVRAGAFALNLSGNHEVELVRQPPNNCDTLSNNPIAISRDWDDRLHYEILIPKKYISLGSSIPMAIKLTPLEKVMVHRVRVHVVETVQYTYSQDPSINYTDRSLKILLYEKKAQTERASQTANDCHCDNANTNAPSHFGLFSHLPIARRASIDQATDAHHHHHDGNSKKKKHREKLTGNLLHYSSTRVDAETEPNPEDAAATTIDCTLPLLSEQHAGGTGTMLTKPTNSEQDVKQLHPDSFNCPNIRIRHRLTISFRISKQDAQDPKRRHFEVKIDTPINFLSKHCVNENVELPEYELDNHALTYISSNDSQYPMSTVALGAAHQLPAFDEAVMDSDSDDLYSPNEPPPDYETIVGQ